MHLGDVFPKSGHIQDLYCDACEGHLDLAFTDFHEDVSGVDISIKGLPVLHCDACQKDYLPDDSRFAIIEHHRIATEKGSNTVRVKRSKLVKEFGFTKVPFLYDADDYYYIPGLYRQFDVGFLTPVFFNRKALLKYDADPAYQVKFASTTYGTIDTEDSMIAFGINKHGKLVMWLGDIAKLPESEQY
jgi:YgiT-type zinc finger domain-containing protein